MIASPLARSTGSTLAIVMATILSGCADLTSPACPTLGGDVCWSHLGLGDQLVTALADTEWGLFAGTDAGGLFRLASDGEAWEPVGLEHARVSALLFVPGQPDLLLAGVAPRDTSTTTAVLFASADSGRTWMERDGGLEQTRPYGTSELVQDPNDPSRIYWAVNAALFRSDDAGEMWSDLYAGKCLGEITCGLGIHALVVARHGRIWSTDTDALFGSSVRWSDDDGASWQWSRPVPNVEHINFALLPDPTHAMRALAGGTLGVLLTEDGGESWERVFAPDRSAAVAMVLAGVHIYAAFQEQDPPIRRTGLYRSRGGVDWERLPRPKGSGGAVTMILGHDGNLLIGGSAGVWQVSR